MSLDASWPLQAAVCAALAGDAGVAALVGTRIYDHVPEDDSTFPYITVGEDTTEEAGTKTDDADWHTFLVHAWSRYRGMKEAKQILDAVKGVLHKRTLTVTGFTMIEMRFEFGDAMLDPDGLTRHAVHRYHALIQATG